MIRLLLLGLIAGLGWYAVLSWRRSRREDELARARAVFFVPPSAPPISRRELPPLREVTLADGQLRFRVPAAWSEEPSPHGAFSASAASSRRLHVALDTTRETGPGNAAGIAEALRGSEAGRQGGVQALAGERVLLKHVRTDHARDGYHLSYCWELWAPRPDRGPLVAAFAFRVPSEALDVITEDDIRLLEREIRQASLSSLPEPS